MSVSPASSALCTTSPSCRSSTATASVSRNRSDARAAKAGSDASPCSSAICAALPALPNTSCPSTQCSCSTATSKWWAKRSRIPAASSTSSSAMARSRSSASRAPIPRPAGSRSPPPCAYPRVSRRSIRPSAANSTNRCASRWGCTPAPPSSVRSAMARRRR
ncbi:hypothetical protein D9M70_567360 [compost metagenome]